MLKILQVRLQQYVNRELPDVKLDLEMEEEPEIKMTTSIGLDNSRKTSTFASVTALKPLNVWITANCVKFFKR